MHRRKRSLVILLGKELENPKTHTTIVSAKKLEVKHADNFSQLRKNKLEHKQKSETNEQEIKSCSQKRTEFREKGYQERKIVQK